MAIDGLIILDQTGRPIIQSGFRSLPPAYPILHIDAVNAELEKADNDVESVDPVLYLALDPPSACCHVSVGQLRILAPISGDLDPLVAFAFIDAFIAILHDYLGHGPDTLSSAALRDAFDVVYQLLEEALDASGHPLTTFPNALRDIVTPPSLLNKILASAGVAGLGFGGAAAGGAGAFTSPIPWRKAGVKYTNNEIYFDMVEELRAIVNKNGATVSSIVLGRIETNAKLSGTPDLLLNFTNPQVLSDCAFHPCVRLQRWSQDKALSFVPPDGRFILMDYRYAPAPAGTSGSQAASTPSAPNSLIPIPFSLRASLTLPSPSTAAPSTSAPSSRPSSPPSSPPQSETNFTLTPRRGLESVCVEFQIGTGAMGVSGGAGEGSHGGVAGTSWRYDSRRGVLTWECKTLDVGTRWNVRGVWNGTTRPARALHIAFTLAPAPSSRQTPNTWSGLRVDQLKVRSTGQGEGYKPYKGVRGRGEGKIEWRI